MTVRQKRKPRVQHKKRPTLKLKREWESGKGKLLNSDWLTYARPIDSDIRWALSALRARSRSAAQNNDHARYFLSMVKSNVIGRQGITLQGRVKLRNGKPDDRANNALEESWMEWGRKPEVTGRMSWKVLCRLVIETVARDGEAIVRKIPSWENRHGFAVQLIDPETLDIEYNDTLGNNRIVMGVELDVWRRPVAYHLIPEGTSAYHTSYRVNNRIRVPADEILHLYLPEWIWQTRGIPWMATALQRLKMLAGYEDAEIVAARVAASKMGFYKQGDAAPAFEGDGEDVQGNPVQDVRPGEISILPPGWEFDGWDPTHPTTAFEPFVKQMLRGIASGLGVNYNTLANDLEGVNYSSLRQGALTERDVWMAVQDWFIDDFCTPVYEAWLTPALLSGAIVGNGRPLMVERTEEFKHVSWQPRRWPWVDPLKDVQANKAAFDMRTKSISSIIREQGQEPSDVWNEIANDNAILEELGISVNQAEPKQAQDQEEEVQDVEDDKDK